MRFGRKFTQSFNPSKYSDSITQSYDTYETIPTDSIEFKAKGHKNTVKVDVGKFDNLCKKFRGKTENKIKNLNKEDAEDFKLMVSYVHLLYGTSHYSHLYDIVRKYFSDVKTVKPGTIGAYFAGCLVSVESESRDFGESTVTAGCTATCAGSMPLPKDEEGWSFCDKAVILAEKGKRGYVFTVVKEPETEEDLEPAYVFVESNNLHDFTGFAKSEKDNLRALGCNKVHLVGYDSKTTNSYDLYGEPKRLTEIKHRHVYSGKENKENANLALWIIVVILVLLLLVGICGYKYYQTKNLM